MYSTRCVCESYLQILHFYSAQAQGACGISECGNPLDKLFGYCFIINALHARWDRITHKRMEGQTNNLIIRCPKWTSQAGGIKHIFFSCINKLNQFQAII